jgi:hypothetical protein
VYHVPSADSATEFYAVRACGAKKWPVRSVASRDQGADHGAHRAVTCRKCHLRYPLTQTARDTIAGKGALAL